MKNALSKLLATLITGVMIASAGNAVACDRSVTITNDGRGEIFTVRIAPSGTGSFSEDLLGDDVIFGGEDYWLDPEFNTRASYFDIEITYANGREVMLWEANLCEVGDIIVDGRQAWTF